MRHRVSTQRLNEKPGHARMVTRNIVTSLLLYETIRTTKKRASVVQPVIDRLITIAKTKTPHVAIRAINRVVTDKNASRKLMQVLAPRYANRPSGMSRAIPVGSRKGDGAPLVDLELLDRDVVVAAPEKKTKTQKIQKKSSSESSVSSESSATSVPSAS